MRIHLLSLTCVFGAVLAITETAQAGKNDVINENKKALTVKISAEGNSLTEALATYTQQIPADHKSSFTVDSEELKGKTHYSIKGDTSAFTPGDKCKHLSVNKDYRITFLNDITGTTCIAEEIK